MALWRPWSQPGLFENCLKEKHGAYKTHTEHVVKQPTGFFRRYLWFHQVFKVDVNRPLTYCDRLRIRKASFHLNPSFKKIHAFSRLCTTPPPLTTPSGKINMSKNRVFLLLRKGGRKISFVFLPWDLFSHFRCLSFHPHKIHRDATSRGFLQCTLESATKPQHRQEMFHQIVVKRVSNIQNKGSPRVAGCHISVWYAMQK